MGSLFFAIGVIGWALILFGAIIAGVSTDHAAVMGAIFVVGWSVMRKLEGGKHG